MTKINPNSSIRSGYTFEDLYVLKHCVHWLLDPKAYSQIQIQFAPEQIGIKHFAIDDVTVTRSDGVIEYYQLKHRQHPERDLWDFPELFKKGLFKWIRSYLLLIESGPAVCALVSNGNISTDISQCLFNEKLSKEAIAQSNPESYKELTKDFTDQELEIFFNDFSFKFNEAGISLLESSLREILYKQLKVTKAGADSLLLYISGQGREMYPKIFTLDEIRSCLSWDNPRPLNQNFEIPSDFEFFDRTFHEKLLNELSDKRGGIKVFTGKPGCGKSTYLSKLYSTLRKNGIMTFRHHYHLNPKDASFAERLNTDRVKEALKAEFKKQKNAVIKELGEINTQHTTIREFINRISEYHREKEAAFVIIIDGLDHVIREGKNREALVSFLNDLLYPQGGLWLIFGTQEMATPCFPRIVEEYAPKLHWTEINGLNRAQVAKIAKKAFPEIVKQHRDYFRESTDILFKLTAGNPLHLRYVLTEINNTGYSISSYDIKRVKPYGGDISNYYTALWGSLSELSQSICYAITALDFKLQKEQLFSLAAHLTKYPAEISIAFKDIAHLIRMGLSGISVYHNSFQVFMNGQPELKVQQTALYMALREWLKYPTQEQLRWSESAKIEYYLGNPQPLLGIDHDWIINSYLECRDEYQIEKLLDLAARAAFEIDRADKVIYFSVVSTYFANREYNMSDSLNTIWSTSFRSKPNLIIPYPDFSRLSHYQIKEILISFKNRGLIEHIPSEAIDRINQLYKEHNIDNTELTTSWIEILISFPAVGLKRIFSFISQFRKSGESPRYFVIYLKLLLADEVNNGDQIFALLKLKLNPSERRALLEVFMHRDMLKGDYLWWEVITKTNWNGNVLMNYYGVYSGFQKAEYRMFPNNEDFPSEYEYYSSEKSANTIALFERTFDTAYFNVLANDRASLVKFLNTPSERWPVKLAKVVALIALTLAERFSDNKRIILSDILIHFDELPELDFSHDFKIYELRRTIVPYIIDKAVWLVQITNIRNENDPEISKPELDFLFHHQWYFKARVFELVQDKKILISEEALKFFMEQELDRLRNEISPFNDKAKGMVNLTLLYKDFQNGVHLNKLLYLAAENILAYGYHKDMFMHNILEGIEILIESDSSKIGEYLTRILPYVYYIEKLTDGDETGHFISNFYLLVARYDKQLLYNFYFHRLNTREYLDSELLWGSVLKALDLNDPVSFAVACTAIDHSGFSSLANASDNPKVAEVIADIRSKFGKLDYSRKEKESNSRNREKSKDKSYIKVLPGNLLHELSVRKNESESTRFNNRGFLTDWAGYWLRKLPDDTSGILHEIRSVLEERPWNHGKEILEIIYPYALKTDMDLAFQCLCWQMVAVGGWNSSYMVHMEDSRRVWQMVIQNFSLRLEEFYKWTISHTGLRYGDDLDYTFPMPKSVQFFTDSGQLERAERCTGYYLDALEGIFPNINLPLPDFWNNPRSVSPLDLLLRRLEWMSPLVRSRAAEKIAVLLQVDYSGEIHNGFYDWLKSCRLETMACHGLFVIIRSLRNKQSCTFKHLGQFHLSSLLQVRCMATDLLLQQIAGLLHVNIHIDIPLIIRISSENPEMDLEHFKKLISRNVTLSYLDFLDNLEEVSPFSVWQAWLCMYKERCLEMGLTYEREDERYENEGQSVMIGRNTIFAEILKSTFFNILDGLYDMNFIDFGVFFHLTMKNLPVDPSLWAVAPTQKPNWWPEYQMPQLKPGDEYPDLSEILDLSFSAAGDQTVLSMRAIFYEGDDFYAAETFCVQEVTAFAYPHGQVPIMGADQIIKILNNTGFLYPRIQDSSNYGVLDNFLGYHNRNQFDSLSKVQLLTAELNIAAHHIWEHYRIFNSFKLLSPFISDYLNIEVAEDSICYFRKGELIAEAADFMMGLRDTFNPKLHLIPHSNYLTINTTFLMDLLKEKEMVLAHVIKEEFYFKDKPYKDEWPKPHIRYRLVLGSDPDR